MEARRDGLHIKNFGRSDSGFLPSTGRLICPNKDASLLGRSCFWVFYARIFPEK